MKDRLRPRLILLSPKSQSQFVQWFVSFLIVVLALTASTLAQQSTRRDLPPIEAVSACDGKAPDANCSFTDDHRITVAGHCITPPRMATLVCAPAGHNSLAAPPRGADTPGLLTPEAGSACNGKAVGSVCSFGDARHGNVAGSCALAPQTAIIVCLPKSKHGLGVRP